MSTSPRSRNGRRLRSAVRELQIRRTPLDLPLLLFFLTVIFGAWSAYSVRLALFKFWVIVAAISLYYLVAALPRRGGWGVAALCGPLAAGLAVYFVTAEWWFRGGMMIGQFLPPLRLVLSLRRFWPLLVPHPNVVAGLLVMLFPFVLAFALYARSHGRQSLWGVTAVSALLALGGLLLTRSASAWLALAAGLSPWAWWEVSRRLARHRDWRWRWIYGGLLAVTAVAGAAGLWLMVRWQLPGSGNLVQRLVLIQGTWRLVQDYPQLGSGLATFPALYAEYIQVVPNFFVSYSNLYLDLLLELGWIGLMGWLWIWLGAGWQLVRALRRNMARPSPERGDTYWLRWATLASLVAMLLRGLSDDTLYSGLGLPFMFFLPAMAILISRRRSRKPVRTFPAALSRRQWVGMGVLLVLGVSTAVLYRQPLLSGWLSAQGALKMDQILLTGWPTDRWRSDRFTEILAPARSQLQRSLAYDDNNRTAYHRLGLIALLERDFDTAVFHLEQAYRLDGRHRGVIKSLGYAYVWQGQPEKAVALLAEIPEAERELREYANWWPRLNRPDLGQQAAAAAALLESQSVP